MPQYLSETGEVPAPVAQVTFRNLQTGKQSLPFTMLIDTGAEATLIPREAARQIGCEVVASQSLSGFDGNTGVYEEVLVEMTFLNKSFKGQFLVIDQPTGIIGRNILNYLVLTFDGPRLVWGEGNPPR